MNSQIHFLFVGIIDVNHICYVEWMLAFPSVSCSSKLVQSVFSLRSSPLRMYSLKMTSSIICVCFALHLLSGRAVGIFGNIIAVGPK